MVHIHDVEPELKVKVEPLNSSTEGWFLGVLEKVEGIANLCIAHDDDRLHFIRELTIFDDRERKRITEALRGVASGRDY